MRGRLREALLAAWSWIPFRQGEGRLWLKWVLANTAGMVFGGIGAGILAVALGVGSETMANRFLWSFFAIPLGTMQWLVLRQRAFQYFEWVGATVAGVALYWVVYLFWHLVEGWMAGLGLQPLSLEPRWVRRNGWFCASDSTGLVGGLWLRSLTATFPV